MIDTKTRNEIIRLWRQGESKASIQRKTGVSQPTIRKILSEAGLDESINEALPFGESTDLIPSPSKKKVNRTANNRDISHLSGEQTSSITIIAPKDVFIINLEQNWPYGSNRPLQCLYNGAPIWEVPRLLKPMYSDHVISKIMQEIDRQGLYKIYEVTVVHYGYGREEVTLKMLNGLIVS